MGEAARRGGSSRGSQDRLDPERNDTLKSAEPQGGNSCVLEGSVATSKRNGTMNNFAG